MGDTADARIAGLEDLPDVLRIAAESQGAPLWTPQQYAEALSCEPGIALRRTVLVAEDRQRVVGFAVVAVLCSVLPPEAELESIAVARTQRGRGFGRTLMRAAVACVVAQRASFMRLEVRAGNAQALRLYQAAGFHAEGLRRAYYADPVDDAVCMALALVHLQRYDTERG